MGFSNKYLHSKRIGNKLVYGGFTASSSLAIGSAATLLSNSQIPGVLEILKAGTGLYTVYLADKFHSLNYVNATVVSATGATFYDACVVANKTDIDGYTGATSALSCDGYVSFQLFDGYKIKQDANADVYFELIANTSEQG